MPALKTPALALTVIGIAALGLAGCTTPEQLRQEDEAACTGYGFHTGTPDFAQCLQRESLARRYGWWSGWPNSPPWW